MDKKLIAIASKALQPMPESSSDTRVTALRHSCISWDIPRPRRVTVAS
jgi:hypothetical protein